MLQPEFSILVLLHLLLRMSRACFLGTILHSSQGPSLMHDMVFVAEPVHAINTRLLTITDMLCADLRCEAGVGVGVQAPWQRQ